MITFRSLLEDVGLAASEVRLLRHKDTRYRGKPTPYALWRDDRPRFEAYQRLQAGDRAAYFASPFWAVFVGTPDRRTLFVGLYRVTPLGPLRAERVEAGVFWEQKIGVDLDYDLQPDSRLSDLAGRLYIDWGEGLRSWIQRADSGSKAVEEIAREFREPEFPGYAEFIAPLSTIPSLPPSWRKLLAIAWGVYLLTCPRTREQYVGIAHGEQGLLDRWLAYAADGHGGDVALRSREASDYQVSILQTVGSATTPDELRKLEALWKRKLQSREMGLNRNL